MADVHRKA